MSSDSVARPRKQTLPCYCTECLYTSFQSLQPLETYLAHNDSLEKLDPEPWNNLEEIAPVSPEGAGPSKSVSRETHRSYSPDDQNISSTYANKRQQPQYPGETYNSGEREPENRDGIEYNPLTASVPTQDHSPSSGAHNRPQYPLETGLSFDASQTRKHNEDLPPMPTQDVSWSNRGPQLQYPQETKRSKTRNRNPSKPSVSMSAQEDILSNRAQTPAKLQQLSETQVSYSAAKPQDPVGPPSIPSFPIQERSQSIPTRDQDRSADDSKTDTRPHLIHGTPIQMDTQYVNMLLALDDIPILHNMYAGFFNWILLAGFILFPGTFTSLKNLGAAGQVEQRLVRVVTSVPLFVIAWLCTGIGAIGMLWLWWRWRRNYIWALNKIFIPGALNSLAGFISTIANIFGAQHGQLSINSKITIIVTAVSTGVLGILTAIYSFWMVKRVRSKHNREVGKQRTGKHGEGVVDPSKRDV